MTVTTTHPLDPLSAEEISGVAAACKSLAKQEGWGSLRFNVISLKEPAKADLLAFEAGGPAPQRQGFAILQAPPSSVVYEVTLALQPGEEATVCAWQKLEGVEPLASPDDCFEAEAIAKADPQVVELLAERGFTDLALVACDPWSVHAPPQQLQGRRLMQLFMYGRSSPDDNAYAHPLDLVALVDMLQKCVVAIDKHSKAPQIPASDSNYHAELFPGPWRQDIKPLNVLQPEGPSFSVDGMAVSWQKWSFRVGFNYREGLVLHQLSYNDGGKQRPVLHRASLVEMAVPYGDPREPFQRKCAFDVGDYGLGYCANSLALGCDCLGYIHYFDAALTNSSGEPVLLKNAVCMHEEDVGLLWKHVEYRNGHSESRRSRRLVLSFISTVVNYEYAFYWYLYQDGTINFEIKLTGELSTNLLSEGEAHPTHGTLVAPGVNAQHHQHLFCARLDMAVDDAQGGKGLLVSEVDAVRMPRSADNPHGNGFTAEETDLTTTSEAQRVAAPERARIWKIKNPSVINPMSKAPVAYKLMPMGASPLLLADEESLVGRRAVFARKHLWVTPHSDSQCFPAGDYVMQASDCRGLALWTKEDQSLVDADPIIWYSFGVTHIVRVEDFPVMPVEVTGFTLKPFGFFSSNPGLDIPPGRNAASKMHSANGGAAAATNGVAHGVTNGACCGKP
ncbi:hypothetical protein OEZ86_000626 [Tetradesmus obliquus]|nr:hypothetical protein OEZ86_000626 [Tetradesmus obliquus]